MRVARCSDTLRHRRCSGAAAVSPIPEPPSPTEASSTASVVLRPSRALASHASTTRPLKSVSPSMAPWQPQGSCWPVARSGAVTVCSTPHTPPTQRSREGGDKFYALRMRRGETVVSRGATVLRHARHVAAQVRHAQPTRARLAWPTWRGMWRVENTRHGRGATKQLMYTRKCDAHTRSSGCGLPPRGRSPPRRPAAGLGCRGRARWAPPRRPGAPPAGTRTGCPGRSRSTRSRPQSPS